MTVKLGFSDFHAVAESAREKAVIGIDAKGKPSVLAAGKSDSVPPPDHQRTWTALLEAAKQEFGADRVERVWNFYRIDPLQRLRENKPLRAIHIHMLEVGTMKVRLEDLREKMGKNLSSSPPDHIRAAIQEMAPFPRYSLAATAREIRGSPTQTSPFFSYDPYLMDQELQILLKDVGSLSWNAYLERLTKAIVSRELPEGMLIPAPSPHTRGQVEYYSVYKCISKGDGLVAYALKPLLRSSKLAPMLVFRQSPYHPSGLDFLETWLNNMQKEIGWLGYRTARGALGKLAYDPKFCPRGQQIAVCGFSLGAAHAKLFIADYFERVKEATFFNSPSIDAETAEMFAVKINALPYRASPMKVLICRTEGDIVDYANEKCLFWGVRHPSIDVRLEVFKPKAQFTSQQAHSWRYFDAPHGGFSKKVYRKGAELDKQLDNSRRGLNVQWYEGKRLIWGSYFIYPILFLWSRGLKLLEYYCGITILRRTPKRQVTLENH